MDCYYEKEQWLLTDIGCLLFVLREILECGEGEITSLAPFGRNLFPICGETLLGNLLTTKAF